MKPALPFAVALDFDGTITMTDVGNALCEEFIPEHFTKHHSRYSAGELSLRALQQIMWDGFPLSEKSFREATRRLNKLRPGVNEFLEKCAERGVPVFVVSCGIRPYIDETLQQHLSPRAREAIKGVVCNDARFEGDKLLKILPPNPDESDPLPLHKGAWVRAQRDKLYPGYKLLAVGDGSSDFSFAGHVDWIAATRKLAAYCDKHKHPYLPFNDFFELDRHLQW